MKKIKQAVILAGGFAKRLKHLTKNTPKSLLIFNGISFINHQLEILRKNKIYNILICVGHLGKKIKSKVLNSKLKGLNIQFSYDGKKTKGTGGALKKAFKKLDENFYLVYGDTYPLLDFRKASKIFYKKKSYFTMCIIRNNNRWDKSNIAIKKNKIINYNKNSLKAKYIDYGVSIVNKNIFKSIKKRKFDLNLIYHLLIENNKLDYFIEKKRFYEIGSFEGIKSFKNKIK
jgi:NDP-sugar pyrophosphorylase family protein